MNESGMPEQGSESSNDVKLGDPTHQEVIDELKNRFKIATTALSDFHKAALDDLKFLNGDQWPERQRRSRESEGRPILTINKLPTFVQQVTNDQRQNKVSIKVTPVSEDADPTTAEIVQGMIRHIEYDSSADIATDTAVNSAAQIGAGYFRLITDYESEDSFNQIVKFCRIRNAFSVYLDPSHQMPDGSDTNWGIITGKVNKKEFKAEYPEATITISNFDETQVGDTVNVDWVFSEDIRVAEYYRKVHKRATLYLLRDGTTTFTKPVDETQIVKKRDTVRVTVKHYFCTPYEVVEETEILCSYIPIFPVYGTEIEIDGKINRFGIIRNAKDPAMMYNFWMTAATEEVAMRPKTPYIGAKGQFKGEENRWKQANNRNFAYLEYEPVSVDGVLAPPPARQPMADIPHGLLTMAMHANDNIKATTGLFDSSLGAAGNAQSGKQEIAQQRQGNIANYHFTDHLYKTYRHAGKCLLEMIRNYYDAERMVMVRTENGEVSGKTINKYDQAAQKFINDVRVGRYGIAVSVGPSYSTMRAEASDAMIEFGKNWPKLMDVAGDKVVETMNWPGAAEIAKRIAKTIPPNIRDDGENDDIPEQAKAIITELEARVKELEQVADDNHAKVTVEQIRQETAIAVESIRKEGREDIEELKGYVQLLLARMPAPPALESEVSKSITDDTIPPTGRAAVQPQAPDQQVPGMMPPVEGDVMPMDMPGQEQPEMVPGAPMGG